MLDFLGTVAMVGLIVFLVGTLLVFVAASPSTKTCLAALIGLWIGLAAAGSAAGWAAISRPFPIMGVFLALPLGAALVATAWSDARRALLGLPLRLLVALNVGRVFAVLFLLLAADGRLSGPFPYSAGWGDIISGVAALPLIGLARDPDRHRTIMHLWNAFGFLDLVAAIALGMTSAQGSALQIYSAPGSEAMQHLPWSFVPTVLMPLWLVLHVIIWVKVRRA